MSSFLVKVLPVLRGLLPMNKIAAWVVSAFLVVLAGVAGLKGDDIKAEICKAEALPAVELPAPVVEEK
jgi:hypothetical protein